MDKEKKDLINELVEEKIKSLEFQARDIQKVKRVGRGFVIGGLALNVIGWGWSVIESVRSSLESGAFNFVGPTEGASAVAGYGLLVLSVGALLLKMYPIVEAEAKENLSTANDLRESLVRYQNIGS